MNDTAMREDAVILGVDTSNYTTSLGLLSADGTLLANIKRPLPVHPGERGLRQSDAVFAHVKKLPDAICEARDIIGARPIAAVGVSTRPRNTEGSYMPCFLVGVAAAESASLTAHAPLFRFSHQCGHVMAALFSAGREDLLHAPFIAFHVSGGTTEVLRVSATATGFDTVLIGGTKDINAGQLIDRVGVYMGLPFPAGIHMEALARTYTGRIPHRKIPTDGIRVNLSGIENVADKLYDESGDPALVSAFVLHTVAEVLASLTRAARDAVGTLPVVYAGGVMSDTIIRDRLARESDAAFATPACSADNAVGIAELTRRAFLHL